MEFSILFEQIHRWLAGYGITEKWIYILNPALIILTILVCCYIIDFITKRIIIGVLTQIITKSKNQYDDILLKNKVFNKLSQLAPAIFIYFIANYTLNPFPEYIKLVHLLVNIYMIIIITRVIELFINSLHEIYMLQPVSKERSIKGLVQAVKVLLYFVSGILILSFILNKSPLYLLSGLGALAAVLLLVFKDTLLGLTASIQLSSNKILKPGDSIVMPKYGAEGIVQEINLHSVKVLNHDRTIVTIPTYTMVSDSFQNLRGIQEAGCRRIRRSINLDMRSIKQCDINFLTKIQSNFLLKTYLNNTLNNLIEKKQSEINITNAGLFRFFVMEFLKAHPKIVKDMNILVRELQPTESGIPIEIYCYTNETEWIAFELLQSDLLEQIISIIPQFELVIFQNPTGNDFSSLKNN